jgi:hypothetical protein
MRNVCADIVLRRLPYDGEIREASILQYSYLSFLVYRNSHDPRNLKICNNDYVNLL